MPVVSFRVPKEVKEEMQRIRINWPEYLREAVRRKIREEKVKQAMAAMDESRARTEGFEFRSEEVAREVREQLEEDSSRCKRSL